MRNNIILVTGGYGFIGSHFIKYLLEKHVKCLILNIDKLTYASNRKNLDKFLKSNGFDHRVIFRQGDISDKEFLKKIFTEFDVNYIVNFAAESHVDKSIKSSDIFFKTNVLGVLNLIECAKEQWTIDSDKEGYPVYKSDVKFVQISTDEVYGDIINGSFFENSKLNPKNPYSASKASADLILLSYGNTFKFPFNIIRSANNFGENQHNEKFIPTIINNAIKNLKIPIYGDGSQIREWIYVKDNVEAIEEILKFGVIGEIYNVSSNIEYKNLDLVKLILDKMNKEHDLIEFTKDRLGHDIRYSIDSKKIKNELNWKCKNKFEDNIENVIKWYKENID